MNADEEMLKAAIDSCETEEQLNSALELARLFVVKHGDAGEKYIVDVCDRLRRMRGE
jgi:hypothetical protein